MHRTLALLTWTACGPLGATPSTPTSPPSLTTPTVSTSTTRTPGHDTFVQTEHEKVDVLYVVQDTAGMDTTRDTAATYLPYFFDYLLGSGIDYHVGWVTADCDDPDRSGKLVSSGGLRWVDADTPSAIDVLSAIEVGSSSATVQVLGATWLALEVERDLANSGFYREDAALHVVVIGDGSDATDPALVEEDAFVAWFEALKADPDDASFSCVLAEGAVATDCAEVSAVVGGVVGEVGGEVLGAVGLETAGAERTFHLSGIPREGTLEVTVEDSGTILMFQQDTDYTYDPAANAITFLEYVPNWGATIVVDYTPAP